MNISCITTPTVDEPANYGVECRKEGVCSEPSLLLVVHDTPLCVADEDPG